MMGFVYLPYFCGGSVSRQRFRRFEYFETKKSSWPSYFEPTRVLVGELPEDFLRLNVATTTSAHAVADASAESWTARQIDFDEQAAIAAQRDVDMVTTSHNLGRLTLTVVEARLVKNYGMSRMDPYVRLRIGHNIYETHTHHNGAKNPRWDKVFHCFIPPGVNSFLVEIFDECAFTANEKIAWAHVLIPDTVLNGETNEEWIPLNGKQGDGKEGAVNLVMSYTVIPRGSMSSSQLMYLNGSPVPTTFGCGTSVRTMGTAVMPTVLPTVMPTVLPTVMPTVLPTVMPTVVPALNPALNPAQNPALNPAQNPVVGITPAYPAGVAGLAVSPPGSPARSPAGSPAAPTAYQAGPRPETIRPTAITDDDLKQLTT